MRIGRMPPWAVLVLVLLLGAGAPAQAQKATLTFLHLNDVYEISPKEGRGGFAPLMTLLRQERAANPGAITTLGGDLLGSSMMSGVTRGAQMIELMNAIGMDLAVVGNHEFDFGPEVFRQRVAESRFPWLGTNILASDGRLYGSLVGTVMRDIGGFKVGFFGVITADTPHLSSPGPEIRFAPVLDTARAAVKELRDQGADVIVALTHLSFAEDRQLARQVKGIDVILGGHDHDPITLYDAGVLIFKVGYDAHYLGVARIEVERTQTQRGPQLRVFPRDWRLISTAGVAPDPEIDAIVRKHEERLDASLNVPLGRTLMALDSRRSVVRRQEAAIGNLIADAMRETTKADVALTNGGGIRGDRSYEAGTTLTRKDVLTELPFGNLTVVLEIAGTDLRAAIEEGLSEIENLAGRFPQVSGVEIEFDARRPKGERVTSITVARRPLDPRARYRLATNEFMAGGGDGYTSLRKGRPIVDASAATLMATMVMDYIAARGMVAPAVEGRIVERK